jgi:hypothetical protein
LTVLDRRHNIPLPPHPNFAPLPVKPDPVFDDDIIPLFVPFGGVVFVLYLFQGVFATMPPCQHFNIQEQKSFFSCIYRRPNTILLMLVWHWNPWDCAGFSRSYGPKTAPDAEKYTIYGGFASTAYKML